MGQINNLSSWQQRRDFSPQDKLIQVFLSILSGCETLVEVNTRLRSEVALASICGWNRFVDQSTLSKTLDALSLKQIDELHSAVTQIWRKHGHTMKHDWRGYLWLDYDLSPLPCGAQAEASQKGYFGKKNAKGRQVARVSAIRYRETVWSEVFPGNFHTVHCFKPAIRATENALDLSEKQRKRTVWRLDGGSGSEAKLRWLLRRGYQLVAKGMNHNRAKSLSKQVQRWDEYRDVKLGEVPGPHDYPQSVRLIVKERVENGKIIHSYYVITLPTASKRLFLQSYDARGAAEIEQFRNDKQGLSLAARRKRDFLGQKAYVLLTDLAHNMIADFYHHALVDTKFESFGPKRIVRDLLAIPGFLTFVDGQLNKVALLSLEQFSEDIQVALLKYISQ